MKIRYTTGIFGESGILGEEEAADEKV